VASDPKNGGPDPTDRAWYDWQAESKSSFDETSRIVQQGLFQYVCDKHPKNIQRILEPELRALHED